MEVKWFNALFKENFEEDYDNVMNCVVDYINYSGDGGNGSDDNVGDGGDTDGDDDDDDNDGDEDVNSFQKQDFGDHKLTIYTGGALIIYYVNFMFKEPCMVLYNTGMRWLMKFYKDIRNDISTYLGWMQ